MKNYYTILGLTVDSSDDEIKSAYRSLARKYHPDVNPSGAERFKDILEAYETLSDPKKRIQYDTINGFFKSAQKNSQTSSENTQKGYSDSPEKKEVKKDKHKPKKDSDSISKKINDIFSKKSKNTPKNGDDIFEEVVINIKEAALGTKRIVNIVNSSACPHCKGRKFINGAECNFCNGSGEKLEHRKISVKIPQGVQNGAKLRIKNEGKKGENGGKNGDLYIKIILEKNSRISIDENNIIYNVPISPFEAVLGGNITIPLFEGNVSLKIPPKTSSGQKFRLSGQGVKKNGKQGDVIVVVNIEIPSYLSDDEIKLYEKLKKLSSKDIRENMLNE